jgi:hypothetical protein
VNPLIEAFIRELRERGIDLEYRGGEQLYAVGNTSYLDEAMCEAIKGIKPRVIAYLKPIWEQGGGKPVRLPAESRQDAA